MKNLTQKEFDNMGFDSLVIWLEKAFVYLSDKKDCLEIGNDFQIRSSHRKGHYELKLLFQEFVIVTFDMKIIESNYQGVSAAIFVLIVR